MFYYHAGLIAAANGNKNEGDELLKKARTLNPHFEGL